MIKFFLNVSLLIICLVSCSKSNNTDTSTDPVSIETNPVTSITDTAANIGVTINNSNGLNIVEAGIVYSSTEASPTIENSSYITISSRVTKLAGNYTINLGKLDVGSTYFVRSYAIFENKVYYGTVQSFKTTLPASIAALEGLMVTVPAGSFTMGATSEQLVNNGDGFTSPWWDKPWTQQVTLSSYKICKYEVTQQLWQDVMGKNPSYFTGNLQRPVERVSWLSCDSFINKLNKITGKKYRLPTEAEWEYAARGGANTTYNFIYSGSNTLNNVASWNYYNSNNQTSAVGTKQANALGLYDMSGNVWEWCNDWYGNYSNTAVTNPQGPATGSYRVIRGGFFTFDGYYNRVSYRGYGNLSDSDSPSGLRLAISSN